MFFYWNTVYIPGKYLTGYLVYRAGMYLFECFYVLPAPNLLNHTKQPWACVVHQQKLYSHSSHENKMTTKHDMQTS